MPLIVYSQSVKGAETVSNAARGFDAGKKINGRKRHIAVDTLGLPVMITVTPAGTTDRDATLITLMTEQLPIPVDQLSWGALIATSSTSKPSVFSR